MLRFAALQIGDSKIDARLVRMLERTFLDAFAQRCDRPVIHSLTEVDTSDGGIGLSAAGALRLLSEILHPVRALGSLCLRMSEHSSKAGLALARKNTLAQAGFEHANGIFRHSEIDCSQRERLVVRRIIEHAHIELQSEIVEIDPFGMGLGGLELEDIPPVLRLRIVSQEHLPGLRDLLRSFSW